MELYSICALKESNSYSYYLLVEHSNSIHFYIHKYLEPTIDKLYTASNKHMKNERIFPFNFFFVVCGMKENLKKKKTFRSAAGS